MTAGAYVEKVSEAMMPHLWKWLWDRMEYTHKALSDLILDVSAGRKEIIDSRINGRKSEGFFLIILCCTQKNVTLCLYRL